MLFMLQSKGHIPSSGVPQVIKSMVPGHPPKAQSTSSMAFMLQSKGHIPSSGVLWVIKLGTRAPSQSHNLQAAWRLCCKVIASSFNKIKVTALM